MTTQDGHQMLTQGKHMRQGAGLWGWKGGVGLVTSVVTWLVGGGVTCSVGRGRGKVPGGPTLLLSSSRARVRRSNCISCSRTDARRDAAFSHCSIHTEREDKALHTAAYTPITSVWHRLIRLYLFSAFKDTIKAWSQSNNQIKKHSQRDSILRCHKHSYKLHKTITVLKKTVAQVQQLCNM